jgi:hypothetical protein
LRYSYKGEISRVTVHGGFWWELAWKIPDFQEEKFMCACVSVPAIGAEAALVLN